MKPKSLRPMKEYKLIKCGKDDEYINIILMKLKIHHFNKAGVG